MDGEDRVVGGRYRLLGRLGAGAMGAVWRAEDLVLGREVAVKEVVFPPGIRPEEMEVLRERTRREARSAARLDHPSAVTVYDVVEEHGRPWLVMELVDARTLADVVSQDGPLPPEHVAQIGLAVLGALQAAHEQGIVHRDVKPGNVMLTDAGRTVLTDFGIATSSEDSALTGTGLLLGSPAYIAPERARGNAPGPASDLWSLGATLFTAVEGRPPYDGKDALETVTAVVTGEHAPFVAAGPLQTVLDGLLLKDPAERLDAAGARDLLIAVVGRTPVMAPRPQPAQARTDPRTAALDLSEVAADVAEADQHPTTVLAPDGEDTAEHALPALESIDPPAPVAVPAAPHRSAPPPAGPAPAPAPPTARPARPTPPPPRTAPTRPPLVVRETRPATAAPKPHRGTAGPLVAAAVLLVLAAVGLVYSFVSSDDDAGPRSAGPTSSSSVPATGSGTVPAGWKQYSEAGWSVAAPKAYVLSTTSRGELQLKDPDSRATLRVKVVSPGPADANALTESRKKGFSKLGKYAERGGGASQVGTRVANDLEFTFFDETGLHVLDRSFVEGGRGYSLYWQTPSDEWESSLATFEQIVITFKPAPTG